MNVETAFKAAAELWVKGLVVLAAYWFGHYVASRHRPLSFLKHWGAYVAVALMAAFLVFVWRSTYGTHLEGNPDGFGGGVTTVVDFVPAEQRDQFALETFLTLSVPALVGVFTAKRLVGIW